MTWLWTVNIINDSRSGKIPNLSPWWPGSSYVNWVGIDGYYLKPNWQFAPLFGPTIGAVRALTNDPILIAETAATPQAGQPAKIADLFAGIRAYGLLGFVWFNSTNTIGQHFGISSPRPSPLSARALVRSLGLRHDSSHCSREGMVTAAEASTRALPRASHRRPFSRGRTVSGALIAVPVVAVLAMQAFASIRLLYATGASSDEALYIYSGHQLVHEMWHGGGSPYYENYFSGAPVIYPVLAAMLDHAGGLVLVRAVSSVFMLIATGLLFATTRRLFGYWPAVVAAGLYAALGITQGLGAYATFDALALMLMAFAAYCAAKSRHGQVARAHSRYIAACQCNEVCIHSVRPGDNHAGGPYAPRGGLAPSRHRAAIIAGVTFFLLAIATVLAGTAYFHGILFTTIARKTGTGVLNLNPATSLR